MVTRGVVVPESGGDGGRDDERPSPSSLGLGDIREVIDAMIISARISAS